MDSPVRQQQKRDDYTRHKLFRKIKRRQKAKREQEKKLAEKELRRKFRIPKYSGGKSSDDVVYETQNTEDGTVYRVKPSAFGAKELNVTTPEVVVKTRDPRKYSSAFDGNQEYLDDLVGFVPIAGDINDAVNAGIAVKNNNYSQAALLGAGLLLPNMIQKPLNGMFKYGMRHINRSFADRLRNQFDALIDLEQSIKNKSYNNNGTEFMQNYVKDNDLVIDGFPKANYIKYKSPDGSKLNVYINDGNFGSLLTNGTRSHSVIETAALKGLPGTGLTYNTHMQYGLTPTEKLQYYRALNSMPNGSYLGEGFNPTLGQSAIEQYRKTGSRFKAYKQILSGGKQTRMNSHFDAPYSVDSYRLVLKQAGRPGYELRYTDVPSWGFNDVGEFNKLIHLGDVDLTAKNLDEVNKYILDANPNARLAYIKDGKLMLPVPILKKSYKYGKSSGIHINPANRGKFNALKRRTGKTTEQLTHSKNPLTRKRAIFAQNAKKWRKGK